MNAEVLNAGGLSAEGSANTSATKQIPALDGIRAISILIVFLSHAGLGYIVPGGFGVTVFFFLSGFLITTLLIREYDRKATIALPYFYMRRVLRLAPPILITLLAAGILVVFGLVEGVLDVPTLMSDIFFYYNYFSLYGAAREIDGTGILWSLSVEEHFYLIWPALFLIFAAGRMQLGHMVWLLAGLLAWRVLRVLVFGSEEWVVYISTDTRLDSLLYGCLLALMNWRGLSARLFPAGWSRHLIVLAALAVLVASFALRDVMFRSTLRYTVQGIALIPLFYYATTFPETPYFKPLDWPVVRRVGVYSFTLYLSHYVILKGLMYQGIAESGSIRLMVLGAVLSLGFAAAVYRFIEKPMLPLRRRFAG